MDNEKKENAAAEDTSKVDETKVDETKVDETDDADQENNAAEEKAGDNAGKDASDKDKAESEESQTEQYMRLMADFQNYKRRAEKEKSEIYDYANQKILADLLTVLDNFERALAQKSEDEAYQKGMEMIFKQFKEVLENAGLEEIEAHGQDFDPNFHHAVLTDSNEDYASGVVTDVLQKGYKLHDRVVRPAMVKVNQ